ncbi:hypothetical protein O6H91_12G036800 [Diphasiastrum complanatum]|uniref:Uncharacterized protein n=1 Tax=Diphasiastrum complanatum TaxID=34168 RepID=A0ACC2C0H8_DIPCM|nr:hypothetical protein O6H91_12G036800 [Diphasiastrum complanatum]
MMLEAGEERLVRACQRLPKVELHAHLNGCIRPSLLLELAEERDIVGQLSLSDFKDVILKEDRSLEECFKLFALIHILTTDHGIITRITKEVIEDFASESVVYLELRTTPKHNEKVGMSKRSYVEAVLAGIRATDAAFPLESFFACEEKICASSATMETPNHRCDEKKIGRIHVRLLLSIDRRESVEGAMETVRLAWEMRHLGIVGIDLSGDPCIGDWKTFLPALTWAKEQGFPVALHCAEVPNPTEVEAMLAFRPDRLGHVCFLEDSEWSKLLTSGIPVEVCLTSNIRTNRVQSIEVHHFSALYNANHPVVICTDDPGIFSTTISREYFLIASHFVPELLHLSKKAIDFTFADEKLKKTLLRLFDQAEYVLDCNL